LERVSNEGVFVGITEPTKAEVCSADEGVERVDGGCVNEEEEEEESEDRKSVV